jgi:hypothetical protein
MRQVARSFNLILALGVRNTTREMYKSWHMKQRSGSPNVLNIAVWAQHERNILWP